MCGPVVVMDLTLTPEQELIRVRPRRVISFGIEDADEALRTAADRTSGSSKVMLRLGGDGA